MQTHTFNLLETQANFSSSCSGLSVPRVLFELFLMIVVIVNEIIKQYKKLLTVSKNCQIYIFKSNLQILSVCFSVVPHTCGDAVWCWLTLPLTLDSDDSDLIGDPRSEVGQHNLRFGAVHCQCLSITWESKHIQANNIQILNAWLK